MRQGATNICFLLLTKTTRHAIFIKFLDMHVHVEEIGSTVKYGGTYAPQPKGEKRHGRCQATISTLRGDTIYRLREVVWDSKATNKACGIRDELFSDDGLERVRFAISGSSLTDPSRVRLFMRPRATLL